LSWNRRYTVPTAIDRLDVFAELPQFAAAGTAAKMAVIAGVPIPADARAEWRRVELLAARVQAADTLVFAVPMWNSGNPWALKLFVDIVTQPGIAFRFDPATGYEGLLGGRRAVTAYSSQVFAPGVAAAFGNDFHSTFFRSWLRFCGIDEVHELRLQPTYPTPDLDARRAAVLERATALGAGARCEQWSSASAPDRRRDATRSRPPPSRPPESAGYSPYQGDGAP
jgi:FMN-dependent NADH-azoreductase